MSAAKASPAPHAPECAVCFCPLHGRGGAACRLCHGACRALATFPAALIAAALIRVFLLATHGVIITDGVVYVQWAETVTSGDWARAFNDMMFNVFPVAVSLVQRVIGPIGPIGPMDHEAAAYLLNFACGLALIYPLYRLARNAFGAAAGVITAWFLALLPPLAEYSSEVVREPLFWCLAAWSLLLFMRAVQPREPRGWSLWRLALSGALALAAMLVRLEALALLGGYGAALLLGHAARGTAWQGGRRILAVIALLIAVPLAGAPAFGYLWQRTGKAQWARLDQVFGQYSLGAIRTGAADPLAVSKDVMYTAGGKVDNAAMVRSLFMRLAARHRHIVFAAEMAGAFWKASYGIGIALIACGAWYALRSRRLAPSSPLAIVSAGVCVIMLAVIARYVATHYYVGTRHALFVVLVLSVFAGAWAGAWPSCDRLCRIVATGTLVVAAVVMLCQDAKPIRRDKLAVRECGIALRAALPPGAVVAGSDAVKTAVYYARRPFRLRPVHAPDRIAAFITAEPRRYLLLNTNDPAQAACATALSGTLRRVEIPLPETKRYAFILLTGAGD